MANRYWVGGSGNWSDNTNHWSATSDGSPGADLPTSSDDVFIDSNSGLSGGTITLNTPPTECHNFTSTVGGNYVINNIDNALNIYGSGDFESYIQFDSGSIIFHGSGVHTITNNGITFPSVISLVGVGTYTLQDDLITTSSFVQNNGTFDANNHNVTANNFYFYADTGYTPTVIMGSGTWEATGDGFTVENYSGQYVDISIGTSTIKMGYNGLVRGEIYYYDDTSSTSSFTFYNFWNASLIGSVYSNGIYYANLIFNNFKINAGSTQFFLEGGTTTISSFTAVGTLGNDIILDSNNSTDQFTLSKSSGTVICDYLNISNSNATGGATWYAGSHSVDTTNNDGWIFEDAPAPEESNGGFFLLM